MILAKQIKHIIIIMQQLQSINKYSSQQACQINIQ